jgi:transposase-like protein
MGQYTPQDKLSGTVEADETYIGGKAKGKKGRGANNKSIVVSLVERNGNVRSQKVQNITAKNLKEIWLLTRICAY